VPLSAALIGELQEIVDAAGVITGRGALLVYDSDGLIAYRKRPGAGEPIRFFEDRRLRSTSESCIRAQPGLRDNAFVENEGH
jgi:hypothetical protein